MKNVSLVPVKGHIPAQLFVVACMGEGKLHSLATALPGAWYRCSMPRRPKVFGKFSCALGGVASERAARGPRMGVLAKKYGSLNEFSFNNLKTSEPVGCNGAAFSRILVT